jgi:glycosyltransferase involved in cell wall biosynthesis
MTEHEGSFNNVFSHTEVVADRKHELVNEDNHGQPPVVVQVVSIITVVKNNASGMTLTLKSIAATKASYSKFDIEWIVVDSCSTDGTQDIIRRNPDIIDKFLIENDNGLYDAMNKGIRLASGDFLLFVNSGDELLKSDSLNELFPLSSCCIHNFNVMMDESDLTFPKLKVSPYFMRMPCHQGMIIPRIINNQIYYYNTKYKINADLDYKLRLFKEAPFKFHESITLTKLEKWGISQNYENWAAPIYIAYREARLAYVHNGLVSAVINFIARIPWHTIKVVRSRILKMIEYKG